MPSRSPSRTSSTTRLAAGSTSNNNNSAANRSPPSKPVWVPASALPGSASAHASTHTANHHQGSPLLHTALLHAQQPHQRSRSTSPLSISAGIASMPDVGTPHASTASATRSNAHSPPSASATPPRRCQTTFNTPMGSFIDLAGPAIPSRRELEPASGPVVAPSKHLTAATRGPTGLPPHLDKWLVSLHSAFAADFLTLRADLDRAHQESLASERTAHAAERENLAQALSITEAAAARNAQAAKWRLQALDLLAHEFRERHAAKARVQAWTAWRAHLARRGHDRFKEHIAAVHAEKQAKFRIVVAWRSVVRDRWRRAERAKMQAEFDRQLADRVAEHTATVASLMQQLTEHADLLAALEQRHRDREDGIRMAFMRGLSALNLETMTVLQDPPPPHDRPASPRPASPTPAAAAVPWSSPPGSFHGVVPDPTLAASTALRMSALVSPRESRMTSWQEAVDEELQQAVLAQRRSPSPDAVQHGPRPARVVKAPPGVAVRHGSVPRSTPASSRRTGPPAGMTRSSSSTSVVAPMISYGGNGSGVVSRTASTKTLARTSVATRQETVVHGARTTTAGSTVRVSGGNSSRRLGLDVDGRYRRQ